MRRGSSASVRARPTRLELGAELEGAVRSRVGRVERDSLLERDVRRQHEQLLRDGRNVLGVRAVHGAATHTVADAEALDVAAHLLDVAGILARPPAWPAVQGMRRPPRSALAAACPGLRLLAAGVPRRPE